MAFPKGMEQSLLQLLSTAIQSSSSLPSDGSKIADSAQTRQGNEMSDELTASFASSIPSSLSELRSISLDSSSVPACISAVQARLKECEQRLESWVAEHTSELTAAISFIEETNSKISSAEESLAAIDADNGELQRQMDELAADELELVRLQSQVDQQIDVVSSLKTLENLKSKLQEIDSALFSPLSSSPLFPSIPSLLSSLDKQMSSAPLSLSSSKQFMQMLLDAEQRHTAFSQRLKDTFCNSFVVQQEPKRFDVSLFSTPHLSLADTWKLLQSSFAGNNNSQNSLQAHIQLVGDFFWSHMLQPLCVAPFSRLSAENSDNKKISFEIEYSSQIIGPENAQEGLLQFTTNCKLLLESVRSHVLDNRSDLCHLFGSVCYEKLSSEIIKQILMPCIPADDLVIEVEEKRDDNKNTKEKKKNTVPVMELIASAATQLDSLLHKLEFNSSSSPSSAAAKTLSSFVREADLHQAQKKRQSALLSARSKLVSKPFFKATVSSSVLLPSSSSSIQSLFEWPSSGNEQSIQVTQSAQFILDICKRLIAEAASSSSCTPLCASYLYTASRDVVDLYRILVPTVHSSDLDSASDLSNTLLLFNDCMFISHVLSTLAIRYRHLLPTPELRELMTYTDLIYAFRDLGNSRLLKLMDKEAGNLLDILDECEGFESLSDEEKFATAEKCIRELMHVMTELTQRWMRPYLVDIVASQLLGKMYDLILQSIVEQVLEISDISEEECSRLEQLMVLLRSCEPLLFPPPSAASASSAPESPIPSSLQTSLYATVYKEVCRSSASPYAPHLSRYCALTVCWNAKMVDITESFVRGQLPFSKSEVTNLIKALFADTENRKKCLKRIKDCVME